MASSPKPKVSFQPISYSNFLQQVDNNNIANGKTRCCRKTRRKFSGELRQPRPGISASTIPKEVIPDLTDRLRNQGVTIEDIGQSPKPTWRSELINFCSDRLSRRLLDSYMMRRMQNQDGTRPCRSGCPANGARRMTLSGIGYDLHRLAEGRKLMIGGIEVPFDKGSRGPLRWRRALPRACDALLGAACLGDIGTHFPDTDPKWKGASSLLFLEHARKFLADRRLRIVHVDAIVICERPKLGPHFPAMRAALAKSLGITTDEINLKAKTNEGVDAVGRGEAIAAHAIATVQQH